MILLLGCPQFTLKGRTGDSFTAPRVDINLFTFFSHPGYSAGDDEASGSAGSMLGGGDVVSVSAGPMLGCGDVVSASTGGIVIQYPSGPHSSPSLQRRKKMFTVERSPLFANKILLR